MNKEKNQDSISLLEENKQTIKENKPGFEGTEKRIELEIKSTNDGKNLRNSITIEDWSKMLEYAKCLILNTKSNENFDSYVNKIINIGPFRI
jgi:hypothetical protein